MGEKKLFKEAGVIFLIAFTILLVISLLTYSPKDPSFTSSGFINLKVRNKAGLVGAYLAGLLFDLFGLGAFILVPILFFLIFLTLKGHKYFYPWRWIGLICLCFCIFTWLCYPYLKTFSFHSISGGGFIGQYLYYFLNHYLKFWGGIIILSTFTIVSVQCTFNFSWLSLFKKLVPSEENGDNFIPPNLSKAKSLSKIKTVKKRIKQDIIESKVNKEQKYFVNSNLKLPDINLLKDVPKQKSSFSSEHLKDLSQKVQQCLEHFGIQGEVEKVTPGPVVSMLEFKPAPGIKVSRIANLSDDLALNLKSSRVRIIAPLPKKDTVGIEIPNPTREYVYLKEILASKVFDIKSNALPLALGKDIQGCPIVVDLAKMPHLLVAGATGAGKSVCLNSFLLSLLFAHPPKSLRLLLIDPKRIELSVYNNLPHLVHPVVTESGLAKVALEWAVAEMEERYELMAQLGVRNIQTYNQKVKQEDAELPYLVVIIDEMADLMLTGGKEIETSIVRLAQLARAAGIHIILATQRPSVDVVTGIIKANFPARIAFQVSSKHDSRTILDSNGAEYLLGMGDMLFKSSGGELKRIHGAYVGEEDIARIVEFWQKKQPTQYLIDFQNWKTAQTETELENDRNDIIDDPKYSEAVKYAIENGKVSISLIQRRFRIGFNKAALFIEQMEKDGIIGPQEGSKPRRVLISK
ncbi:DNA translocase FtsK [Desulfonauticus submarinus]